MNELLTFDIYLLSSLVFDFIVEDLRLTAHHKKPQTKAFACLHTRASTLL